MWKQRSSVEMTKWDVAARREARFQAFLFVGLGLPVVSAVLAGGWVASARWIAAQDRVAGSFWSRFLFFILIGLPFAAWVYRREQRRQLERASLMTICPKCDKAEEGNAGARCACGGEFVLQSSVRWEDEEAGISA